MLNRYLWVAISRDISPKVSERVDIFEFIVVYMDFGKGCLVDLCLHAFDNAIRGFLQLQEGAILLNFKYLVPRSP